MIKRPLFHYLDPRFIVAIALLTGVISTMSLGFFGASRAHAEEFDCSRWLQPVVNFNLLSLKGKPGQVEYNKDRIRAETESITPAVAQSYHTLRAEMKELRTLLARILNEAQLSACAELSEKLSAQLDSFFDRRLTFLLDQGRGEDFFFRNTGFCSDRGNCAERK